MSKISFIGSGNVATHLARAFYAAGHQILQVWSREIDHAETLANQVFAEPVDKLSLLFPTADVYIISITDDALFDIALDLQMRHAIVLHTAGSVSLNVLKPISRRYGVIWSPQTFIRDVAMDYSTLPFCIEGSSPEVLEQIRQLASSVSDNIYNIDSNQRQWLHLASVFVNNFGNAVNALAQNILDKHDIPFEILHPLVTLTAEKIKHGNLWQQQTGPARRQDHKTIDRQRSMVADNEKMLALYDIMTELIQDNTVRHAH